MRSDEILEITNPAGVGMTFLADAALFGQGLPHHGVAPHGQVQDDGVVVEEAILPEHAQSRVLGQGKGAMRRLFVASQEAQEGGFS